MHTHLGSNSLLEVITFVSSEEVVIGSDMVIKPSLEVQIVASEVSVKRSSEVAAIGASEVATEPS